MSKLYGYVRVSTSKQNIQRQIDNIKRAYPQIQDKDIYRDSFTGTTLEREDWKKLYKIVKPGDTIVFDEVSRLSRDAKEGFEVYQELYTKEVNLVFLKEQHINTEVYKQAQERKFNLNTGGDAKIDLTVDFINKLLMIVAKEQIELAFKQAQNERDLLSQRVKEGLAKTDKVKGKPQGLTRAKWNEQKQPGEYQIKKEVETKPQILELSKDFNGNLTDKRIMELLHLSRNTYYKYKRELKQEI